MVSSPKQSQLSNDGVEKGDLVAGSEIQKVILEMVGGETVGARSFLRSCYGCTTATEYLICYDNKRISKFLCFLQ